MPRQAPHTDAAWSDEETFRFYLGHRIACRSSNVQFAQWMPHEEVLNLWFGKPGGTLTAYHYLQVDIEMAESFAQAPSKGVWRHTRLPISRGLYSTGATVEE